MGQQLNIKSDHAYAVANKLSEMTGQSLTTVVTMALDQFLEREERARDREARIHKIRKLTAEIRQNMPGVLHALLMMPMTGITCFPHTSDRMRIGRRK